jgi:hypothetical protein
MESNGQNIQYDSAGYDLLTPAIRDLIDTFPGLDAGESFSFSMLNGEYGQAIFPTTGAVVQYERESITGHVEQMCLYPFTVVLRVSGQTQNRKANAKEWLDMLGRWLEMQPITIGETTYKLDEYPELNGDAKIMDISRTTPAYLTVTNADMSEDWVISIQARYRNEFDR